MGCRYILPLGKEHRLKDITKGIQLGWTVFGKLLIGTVVEDHDLRCLYMDAHTKGSTGSELDRDP